MAWVFSANDRFENSFGEGAPLRTTPFSNDEFQAAAQMPTEPGSHASCPPPTYHSSKIVLLRQTRPLTPSAATSKYRGANGVAMPTDEDDQEGHFFYNHPERGAYSAA